eukprot:TRINITY_DN21530_c0_g1_i2.p1 TRINITY_DN21530_c0_g1~~TRINITY_DN21530_c0_g1_i2.p1  ORF type:complete len:663 (+),score=211.08 TRINITY_DN21530_c0_g1_i2:37-2025(+)
MEGMASPREASDVVNCHFSVNQQALTSMMAPILEQLVRERGLEDRMVVLEKLTAQLRESIVQKADAVGLHAVNKELQEQKQQLLQKASQQTVAATQAQLRSLEATLGWKADQSVLDEQAGTMETLNKMITSKADQSAMNRAMAAVQKVQTQVSVSEKMVMEAQGRLQKLEAHNLAGQASRVADQLNKVRSQVQRLQEVQATKADYSFVEALGNVSKELEASMHLKAGPQTIQELRSAIRDLQLKVDLKVDAPVMEEHKQEFRKAVSQLSLKAEQQELRETAASMNTLRVDLDTKVDSPTFGTLRERLQSLEVSLNQKASQKDLSDITLLKDGLGQKADRKQVMDLLSSIEKLQQETSMKLEGERSAARRDAEVRGAQIKQLETGLHQALNAIGELQSQGSKLDDSALTPRSASPHFIRSDTSQETSQAVLLKVGQLDNSLREAMQALDGKVERVELEERLALSAEASANEQRAVSSRMQRLDGCVQQVLAAVEKKADRSEIEDLLSAAAEAAAAGISEVTSTEASEPAQTSSAAAQDLRHTESWNSQSSTSPPKSSSSGLVQGATESADTEALDTPVALQPCSISLVNSPVGTPTAPKLKNSASAPGGAASASRVQNALGRAKSSGRVQQGSSPGASSAARLPGAPVYPAKGTRLTQFGWTK